jgi:hypothetical protein
MYLDGTIAGGRAMPDKQINSEGIIAGLSRVSHVLASGRADKPLFPDLQKR